MGRVKDLLPENCEGCGWPLQPGQDRLCDACALEMAEIDAEMTQRRFMDLKEEARNEHR